jgi:NAD(P)-dependent dehydrogenase (short-subunit alcohol dehydrogenase family)
LAEKIALVTGAGSGVGKAASLALAKAGFALVLAGRRPEPLQAVAQSIKRPALVVPTDVADPKAVAHLFEKTQATFGRLDLLFNNAGVGAPGLPLEDLTYDQWRTVIDGNLTGAFLCTQAAFKLFKAQAPRGGRIINNGSLSAQMPRPFTAAYVAAKHGVNGLTKSSALEGRPFDIAVGQIDIGNAATDMTAGMVKGVAQANGTMMVEPRIDPRHVADAVVYMASLPLDANVLSMTVMATQMPFVGRG